MREYELTVIYDLSIQESGGPDASTERLKQIIESRGARILKVDHWGRRRMAYPIRHAIDGDYIVTRIEAEPSAVAAIDTALRIDE
uniref:30S ribosomal protein S6 n=1 Tax=Tepidiforma sp. TaxID=2682230 RepID=UPI002ADE39FD